MPVSHHACTCAVQRTGGCAGSCLCLQLSCLLQASAGVLTGVFPCCLLPAEANVLSYLATAKPLVTSAHEATGFCLHPSSSGPLLVKPCLPSAAANPNWKFDPSSSQILLKGSRSPTLCLSGSASEEGVAVAVAVAACAAGSKEQQWQLSAARHLRSAGGVCLGLGASGEVAAVACGSATEAVWSFGGKCEMRASADCG